MKRKAASILLLCLMAASGCLIRPIASSTSTNRVDPCQFGPWDIPPSVDGVRRDALVSIRSDGGSPFNVSGAGQQSRFAVGYYVYGPDDARPHLHWPAVVRRGAAVNMLDLDRFAVAWRLTLADVRVETSSNATFGATLSQRGPYHVTAAISRVGCTSPGYTVDAYAYTLDAGNVSVENAAGAPQSTTVALLRGALEAPEPLGMWTSTLRAAWGVRPGAGDVHDSGSPRLVAPSGKSYDLQVQGKATALNETGNYHLEWVPKGPPGPNGQPAPLLRGDPSWVRWNVTDAERETI